MLASTLNSSIPVQFPIPTNKGKLEGIIIFVLQLTTWKSPPFQGIWTEVEEFSFEAAAGARLKKSLVVNVVVVNMDRRIPDVWDIFSLTGPGWTYDSSRRVGARYDHNGMHTNWSPHARNTQMLMQWCDRYRSKIYYSRPKYYKEAEQSSARIKSYPVNEEHKIIILSGRQTATVRGPMTSFTRKVRATTTTRVIS